MDYCPGRFLLSYSVIVFSFSLFCVSVPFARLSWPSRQLFSARKSTVSYSCNGRLMGNLVMWFIKWHQFLKVTFAD